MDCRHLSTLTGVLRLEASRPIPSWPDGSSLDLKSKLGHAPASSGGSKADRVEGGGSVDWNNTVPVESTAMGGSCRCGTCEVVCTKPSYSPLETFPQVGGISLASQGPKNVSSSLHVPFN